MKDKRQPRPVGGSRRPTSAPRRIAGRRPRPDEVPTEPVETAAEELVTEPTAAEESPDEHDPESGQTGDEPGEGEDPAGADNRPATEDPASDGPDPEARQPGLLGRTETTWVLGAVAAVVVLLILAMGAFAGWQALRDDLTVEKVLSFSEPYQVNDEPVQIPVADWNDANQAAQDAVTEMFTFTWENYDENVEAAQALITDRFATSYEETTRATRPRVMDAKADYEVMVVGRAVIEATPDEVATLLFLNQVVYKGEGEERVGPEVYQSRVRVRMVRTDDGWLLDELQPE